MFDMTSIRDIWCVIASIKTAWFAEMRMFRNKLQFPHDAPWTQLLQCHHNVHLSVPGVLARLFMKQFYALPLSTWPCQLGPLRTFNYVSDFIGAASVTTCLSHLLQRHTFPPLNASAWDDIKRNGNSNETCLLKKKKSILSPVMKTESLHQSALLGRQFFWKVNSFQNLFSRDQSTLMCVPVTEEQSTMGF